MAKRVYTKKGDVYEIRIDNASKKYMQFIGLDRYQLNSDTFRVYKKVYPIDATPSLEEILSDIPDFYVHSYASGGIKDGLWSLVYRSKDVGDTSGIKFRTAHDFRPEGVDLDFYKEWCLWTFSEDVNNAILLNGRMPEEWKSAYLGAIYQPVRVLYRIVYGNFPFEPKFL